MPKSTASLMDIAIAVERRGIAFYDTLARSTQEAGARHIFEYLAAAEKEHMATFEKMLPEAAATSMGEYSDYLSGLIDNSVFTGEIISGEAAMSVNSDIQAVELGITAEKDSILLYYEMKDIVSANLHSQINRIIAEEKLHLRQLAELGKRLTTSKEGAGDVTG